MPQIEIRPTTPADIPILVSLEHTFQTSHVWQMERLMDGSEMSITFREVRLPRTVRVEYPYPTSALEKNWMEHAVMLTAVMQDDPVGYLRVNDQLVEDSAWVSAIVVREALRRKGIGTALVMAAQQWAAHRGLRRMILEMQSKNYPAVCFAQKMGYDFCGYNDHYYINQDIGVFFARFLH